MSRREVLDLAAITAAGVPAGLTAKLPTGEWNTYKRGDPSVLLSYGYDEQDDQGQDWWTGTRYVDHEPADTFSYPSLVQLLDHVARETR